MAQSMKSTSRMALVFSCFPCPFISFPAVVIPVKVLSYVYTTSGKSDSKTRWIVSSPLKRKIQRPNDPSLTISLLPSKRSKQTSIPPSILICQLTIRPSAPIHSPTQIHQNRCWEGIAWGRDRFIHAVPSRQKFRSILHFITSFLASEATDYNWQLPSRQSNAQLRPQTCPITTNPTVQLYNKRRGTSKTNTHSMGSQV